MSTFHARNVCVVIALSVVSLAILAGCEGQTRQGTLYSIQPDRELEETRIKLRALLAPLTEI